MMYAMMYSNLIETRPFGLDFQYEVESTTRKTLYESAISWVPALVLLERTKKIDKIKMQI
jgi:hypothetical protein